jgi:hypothetical protein
VNKQTMAEIGGNVMRSFCSINDMPAPEIRPADPEKWAFGQCAYYRPQRGIVICIPRCAGVGVAGRAWSFPGYTVDRTPYGVIQHELGHHADVLRGTKRGFYWSEFSAAVRGTVGEKPITSYCPNDAEWFAEMFRVFVTNPDMLKHLRPRTHRELSAVFKPVFSDTWRDRLAKAPARTLKAAERKVEEARA